ncbi:MAG: metalloregulator ArsR/SmtB family transcription factor [Clostridia bacterium]|nr:metalloregulator ArsR/SmtB family transcription factor [Clostridia bacterium]
MAVNGINALALFKALGDESRLRIVQILIQGESYVELIASRLGLTSATVSHHLKKLEEAGLVECHRTQFYMIYSLKPGVLGNTLEELIAEIPQDVDDDTKYRNSVIENFMPRGTLKQLPAQQKKREIILRHILSKLEKKDSYTEKEINEHIKQFHDDYCFLRREMIALGMMTRDHESGEERYYLKE